MNTRGTSIPIPAGFGFLRRSAGVNPLIINYHLVSDDVLPHVKHLYPYRDIRTFRSDLDFLEQHFTPVDLIQLLGFMKGEQSLPENAAMVTFDDGFRETEEVAAPILKEKGIPATFFLTTSLIDNRNLQADNKRSLVMEKLLTGISGSTLDTYNELADKHGLPEGKALDRIRRIPYGERGILDELGDLFQLDFGDFLEKQRPYVTSEQVSSLIADGFTIGGHSIDHPRFSDLPLEDQVRQAIACTDSLVDDFGLKYRVFAFPYSDHGVSRALVDTIASGMDATFGTSGLLTDSIPMNFQRISLEKHPVSAKRTIKFHYLRRMVYKARKREVIQRDI